MNRERLFDFRRKLLKPSPGCLLDPAALAAEDDYVFADGCAVWLCGDADEVSLLAAKQFINFLFDAMGVCARMARNADMADVMIRIDASYGGYKCYRIDIGKEIGIRITTHDGRGAAQALYHMENQLSRRRAPFLTRGITEREPLFSPRMVHSGYGYCDYPDAHLRQIAHSGMDAIIIPAGEAEARASGALDIHTLVFRAARYGIDVYAYSRMPSKLHPSEPGARAYYEALYGELFNNNRGLKGIVLVGESTAIPSRDPAASPPRIQGGTQDGIPYHLPPSDVWPCEDYAELLAMIESIIHTRDPGADIVFWTYNFGNAPEDARIKLLRALPAGISLLSTFEMFEKYPLGDATGRVSDYTLAIPGPGTSFLCDARVAAERGMRLYAMSNTAGLTWDFGGLPYEPMPRQWMKRHSALRQTKREFGLCGLMESHEYGFWPSFISDMAREAFENPFDDDAGYLRAVSAHFGAENVSKVRAALDLWSEAIAKYIPSNENQYGAFRVGPSYPFNFQRALSIPRVSAGDPQYFYARFYPRDDNGGPSPSSVRILPEMNSLEEMLTLLRRGIDALKGIPSANDALSELINLGEFMACCITTGIHAMQWHLLISRLKLERESSLALKLCDEAEALAREELKNVHIALPLVERDSRLGWDPVMGYVCAPEQLAWKTRQLHYVIDSELRAFRAALTGDGSYERLFYDTIHQ